MDLPTRPAGVLVIRLWTEGPEPAELRARLHATADVVSDHGRDFAVAGREALLEAVGRWVDGYVAQIATTAGDAPKTRRTVTQR